jgi:hypothetical protein
VCVELEGEGCGGGEGVRVKVRQPLRDVWRGHPEAQVLDRAPHRCRPCVKLGGAEPLLRGHRGRGHVALVVGLIVAGACAADHIGCPRQDPRHGVLLACFSASMHRGGRTEDGGLKGYGL